MINLLKGFKWDPRKEILLTEKRGISFNQAVENLTGGNLLDVIANKNYPNQKFFVVWIIDYVYLVPYVEEEDYYFLKTIIPNRNANKQYSKGSI